MPVREQDARAIVGDEIQIRIREVERRLATLGAQSGPRQLEDVLRAAGLGVVRRAAETPFNLIIEARR